MRADFVRQTLRRTNQIFEVNHGSRPGGPIHLFDGQVQAERLDRPEDETDLGRRFPPLEFRDPERLHSDAFRKLGLCPFSLRSLQSDQDTKLLWGLNLHERRYNPCDRIQEIILCDRIKRICLCDRMNHMTLRARNALHPSKPPPGSPIHELRASGAKLMAPAKSLKRTFELRLSRQRVEAQRKIESARAGVTAPLTPPRARPTTDSSEASSPAILGVLLIFDHRKRQKRPSGCIPRGRRAKPPNPRIPWSGRHAKRRSHPHSEADP